MYYICLLYTSSSLSLKRYAAVLPGGGEGDRMHGMIVLIFREMFFHRHKGGVVILQAVQDISDNFFRGDLFFQHDQVLHLHGAFGQRTGFIQTQYVHPGQCLDTEQLLSLIHI